MLDVRTALKKMAATHATRTLQKAHNCLLHVLSCTLRQRSRQERSEMLALNHLMQMDDQFLARWDLSSQLPSSFGPGL